VIFEQIAVGAGQNFAYIIGDEDTKECAVVDPSNPELVFNNATKNGMRIIYIINTHGHMDHIAGNDRLMRKTGAKLVAHNSARKSDIKVGEGNIIKVGSLEIKVIHTPGHTPDSICLLVDNKLITGDTLFVGECGRTDFPGGDSRALHDSLFNKILKLDDNIEVYPGHDYGAKPSSTIGYERKHNYTLEPRTVEAFVRFMAEP